MNQELQLFTNEELFIKIKILYEWLYINEDDTEKYNSFNLKELNELYRILQKHKEYREMEIEERRIARIKRMQK
jgi:RNA polymerase-interacting CarD/CdnL/TRCF family regulator